MRQALLTALALAAPLTAHAADTYSLDPAHTQTVFNINHLGYSTMTGGFHDLKGTLVLDQAHPENSKVDVVIGTASVDTGFAARDADLRGAGFFNVAQFPNMEFRSTRIGHLSDKTAEVAGQLTLLGVPKPVLMKVTLNRMAPDQLRGNATVVGFTGTTTIKRSDFGMKTYLPYIGDDVTITVNFEGTKQ